MMLVLLLAAAVAASPVAEDAVPAVKETAVGQEGADRDAKLFSVFQIIKFNNDACTALDGSIGSCYTGAECTTKGGKDGGKCAAGFGVCCISIVDPNCPPAIVRLSPTLIVNPGFPNNFESDAVCAPAATNSRSGSNPLQPRIFFPPAATTTVAPADPVDPASITEANPKEYVYKIGKISADVVQMRIDFLSFVLAGPAMGMCTNETLVITGVDKITERVMPAVLCGVLTGQHMYVSVKDLGLTDDDADLLMITIKVTGDGEQRWQIRVTQIESSETDKLAPRGCLQYHMEEAGTLTSFNYDSGNGQIINDVDYSICFKDIDGLCDVSLTSTGDFDLNKGADACDDYISFGGVQFCGSTFANAGTLTWNYTGPYVVNVFHDGDSMNNNIGFDINFIMLPSC